MGDSLRTVHSRGGRLWIKPALHDASNVRAIVWSNIGPNVVGTCSVTFVQPHNVTNIGTNIGFQYWVQFLWSGDSVVLKYWYSQRTRLAVYPTLASTLEASFDACQKYRQKAERGKWQKLVTWHPCRLVCRTAIPRVQRWQAFDTSCSADFR